MTILAGVVLVGLLIWLYWHFFYQQVRFALNYQADWGHTMVVPLLAGYLVYLQRDKLRNTAFRTNWLGLLPIFLGIFLYIACSYGIPAWRHHNLMGAGVSLTIFGLVLLFFGWRATLILLFPMLYLFVFGQTVSTRLMDIVTHPMQDITARGSHFVMDLFLDIDRMGNTLFIFHEGKSIPLNIAEACSGMRMLMAFFALGVLLAYTGLPRMWQRILLVMMALPTAIVVNILRVITLGVLSLYDTQLAAGDFHELVGLVWLVPAYLLFLGIRQVIRNLVLEEEDGAGDQATSKRGGD
ncbi:MAG: exosortase/archaeosortase family protein [Planctomycetota bacterium]|nr:exosortase/archaeosortase family protein [Planctomycetota bacterium]